MRIHKSEKRTAGRLVGFMLKAALIATTVLSCLLSSSCMIFVAPLTCADLEENVEQTLEDHFKQDMVNPFEEPVAAVKEHKECFALAEKIRSMDYESIAGSVDGEETTGRSFLETYTAKFSQIVPDASSDKTAIMYRNCCCFVSYAEFLAKKYEYYADNGLLASLYTDDAERYRGHADALWLKLENAQTEEHLQEIIDYCEDTGIIARKQDNDAE